MREFVITTDNMADLPQSFIDEKGLGVMSLTYMIDGETYDMNHELPVHEFYEKMRKGSMPTTSQVNPESAREEFLKYIQEGKDILHIAFSSGLSGSYQSAKIAADELLEEYPESKIAVVDSLAASLGEGLLVQKAVVMKEQGKSFHEIHTWLEEHKLNACHNFTVDDLFHLFRGGRVSRTTAILGTMINIKPIMHVDNEGKLIPIGKVRGRKRSLLTLVDNMEKQMGSYRDKNDIILISHGDCLEDAYFVRDEITKRFGFTEFIINHVGPTIGAHSGPGTLALFFLGEER
ncbi:MAG TPA: DegV family protein [Candidatus Merdenecus merdavium]|nr:DegV family protein [Candidatus Merdenecus merdavium]